ncbi:MAG TPA: Yip1 family protein [Thermoanaerobaculia bacterium]|jgi:hypothetical protein
MSVDYTVPAPPAPPAPEPPATNSFARLAGALFAPAKTFAEIARRPDILVPLIVIVLIGYVSTFLIIPKMDWSAIHEQQAEQVKKRNPNVTDADMERMSRFAEATGKVMGWISPLLMLLWYVVVAGVMLLAFRLMGGEGNFKQAFSATLYAWLPLVILSIVMTIVVTLKGSFDPTQAATLVKSNPAFLVDQKTQPVLFSLLSSFDVFTIWTLVLLTFGFSALSKFSRAKSAVIVVVLWGITIVIKIGLAAVQAMAAAA